MHIQDPSSAAKYFATVVLYFLNRVLCVNGHCLSTADVLERRAVLIRKVNF
jgi:hypothetical protein